MSAIFLCPALAAMRANSFGLLTDSGAAMRILDEINLIWFRIRNQLPLSRHVRTLKMPLAHEASRLSLGHVRGSTMTTDCQHGIRQGLMYDSART